MNKLSVLIVCEKALVRSLLMMELNKSTEINIIGSCKDDSTLDRFLDIYHPQVVLIYSFSKKKIHDYKVVRYLRKKTTARIIILSPNILDYEVGLFLRYGAHSVTDSGTDIIQFIKDTSTQLAVTQFPLAYLRYLPQYHRGPRNIWTRGLLELFLGYNSGFTYYQSNDVYNTYNQTNTLVTNSNKTKIQQTIRDLKRRRELPENDGDLVDYARLFPDQFMPIKAKNNDGKKRFLFISSKELCSKVEKLRGYEKDEIDKETVHYKNYVYDFETTDALFNWRPYDKR